MKAEDIRVGDYFMVKPSGMPIKIAAVHNKKIGYHATSNKLEWVRIDLLKPVPITPEILEKSGFIQNNSSLWILWKGNTDNHGEPISGYEVTVWKNGDCSIQSWDCDMGINITCKTVSELQHAMRLCRIEKEITLN